MNPDELAKRTADEWAKRTAENPPKRRTPMTIERIVADWEDWEVADVARVHNRLIASHGDCGCAVQEWNVELAAALAEELAARRTDPMHRLRNADRRRS